MRTIQRKIFLWLLLPALSLTSCLSDRFDDEPGGISVKDAIHVKFALQMPNGNPPATYAITEIDENEVKTIDVLAFVPVTVDAQHPSGYAFAYKAQVSGAGIIDKPGYTKNEVKEFTVTLIKKAVMQNFVILANVRDQVDGLGDIAVGADKEELLKRLVFANAGSWNANNGKADDAPDKTFMPFPMWGEVSQLVNDATTQITNGKLLRGIARLDVVLGDDVISGGNFYLEEVHIYNSKNKGQIVPDAANITGGRATAVTIPTGSINNVTPLPYTVPTAMKNAFERSIYLFEARAVAQDKSSEATCMVVGGRFGSDTETSYYRLDFLQADGKTYKDVLRNHHYRVNIVKVEGRGLPTADDAFNSKSINMETEITEWNDGEFGTVVFDGQHFLAVTPAEFRFAKNEITSDEGDNRLTIYTDVAMGWKIDPAKITYQSGGTGWLTPSITSGGTTKQTIYLKVNENTSGVERTAIVPVSAGRLVYNVTVTQTTAPKKTAVFNFIEYTPAPGAISTSGATVTAKVNTNMGWAFKTSINGVEASMAEPAGETASDYTLSVNIPAMSDLWTIATTKVWIDYKGIKLQEATYTQTGYYITATGVPATLNKYGQDVTLNLSGYFPAMNFRAVNAVDESKIASNVVTGTATGSSSANAASTVTLTIYPNSSGADRNVKFQYEKSPGVWGNLATSSQEWNGLYLPTAGVIAPPGVIGVGASTGRLTLDGSKEYPDGTAGETVYCVYFKWGSTVAMSAGTGLNNDAYNKARIAWVPSGFTGTITDAWSSVKQWTGVSFPAQDNANGYGDPCKLAVKNGTTGNNRIPSTNPYEQYINGGWVANYSATVLISGRWSNYGSTKSQFYPAAGTRDSQTGALLSPGETGLYWSGLFYSGVNSYCFSFNNFMQNNSNINFVSSGHTVRCIQQ